jgi:uncharacterized protein (TIGR02246 family)
MNGNGVAIADAVANNVMKLLFLAASIVSSIAVTQDSPAMLAKAYCTAIVAKNPVTIADLYTEDAISYAVDGTVSVGRKAIAAKWAPLFAGYDNLTCNLRLDGEAREGNTHTAWGLWSITGQPVGGTDTVTFSGRYMDVSVKTSLGWRFRADHASLLVEDLR